MKTMKKTFDFGKIDWYGRGRRANAVEKALDRPTVVGMVSAAREAISTRCAKVNGHPVVLSKRTLGILARSELGKAAGEKPKDGGA